MCLQLTLACNRLFRLWIQEWSTSRYNPKHASRIEALWISSPKLGASRKMISRVISEALESYHGLVQACVNKRRSMMLIIRRIEFEERWKTCKWLVYTCIRTKWFKVVTWCQCSSLTMQLESDVNGFFSGLGSKDKYIIYIKYLYIYIIEVQEVWLRHYDWLCIWCVMYFSLSLSCRHSLVPCRPRLHPFLVIPQLAHKSRALLQTQLKTGCGRVCREESIL